MKRKTKIAFGGLALLLGAVVLSGCTASFCTVTDKAHILYAFDYGVTRYVDAAEADSTYDYASAYINGSLVTLDNVKIQPYSDNEDDMRLEIYEYCKTFKSIDETATKNNIKLPSLKFLYTLDAVVLGHILTEAGADGSISYVDLVGDSNTKGALTKYGYLKFEDSSRDSKKVLWSNFDSYIEEVKDVIEFGVDDCPSNDYLKIYKQTMNSSTATYRSCLAVDTGDFGAYGPNGVPVEIQGKKWTDWKGLLEFLLVWPIGALIDVLTKSLLSAGVLNGVSQMLSILIVTFLIRGLMLLMTIKQSSSNAKLNELQPEIQKIQAKYPNSNTDSNQRQRMAADMQKLYKKNNVNPASSLIVMIIQFPVFICVWGAMQGSAYLSSGEFLGLRLSDSISSVLFNGAKWSTGAAETALVLFLLMSAAQVVAMLLPQWIQKSRSKKVAKLGKNPAQSTQNNRMKWVTYIMLFMIIFMGFSLASGMGIYWLFGALFSIAQTLIMQKVNDNKAKQAKYGKNENVKAKKKKGN